MRYHKKPFFRDFCDFFHDNWRQVCYVFLGVGLTIYVLNLASLLTGLGVSYNKTEFGISVFLSILMIVFIVHSFHNKR